MSLPVNTARSHAAERRFGLAVGTVWLLLGSWWTYRGKFGAVGPVAAGIGAVLVASGILVPRALVWPNRAWMGLAEALSFVSTRVVLAVVFFVAVAPIGIIRRLTGSDPLRRRGPGEPSYWRPYPERQRDPRHYEKMY